MNPRKLILPGFVVLLIVAAVIWSALRPVPVESVVLTRGTIQSFVEEEGMTRVVDRFVLSSPVAGRMLRVLVKEGDRVKQGDLLVEIDRLALDARVIEAESRIRSLEHRLSGVDRRRPTKDEIARSKLLQEVAAQACDEAEHGLSQARATAKQASRDASRAKILAAEGTVPESEWEEARLAEQLAQEALTAAEVGSGIRKIQKETAGLSTRILMASARDVDWEEDLYREQMKEIRAGLTVLTDDVTRSKITAPVDGVVLQRFAESETVLAAGTPLLEIGNLGGLEVEADLLSEDAARLEPGMQVVVTGRAISDGEIVGHLSRVYPSAFKKISSLGVEQQRVTVVAEFAEDGLNLGDRYRLDLRVILEERENAVLIPEAALFRSQGEWRAFKIEDGRARIVTVKTGIRDGRKREVLEGLAEGDQIIIHPDATLEDAARVAPRGGA